MHETPSGISLKEYLLTSKVDISRFLNVSIEICTGLQEIHSLGIIHKRLNPENIYIDPDKQTIKIAGFGPFVTNEHPIKACSSDDLGDIYGPDAQQYVLLYASPEHTGRTDRPLDFRSDLYSLGAVMYEMLTKKPPFISDDPLALIHCHMAKDPVFPYEHVPDIPEVISRIVMKLLSKSPKKRFQTIQGLQADLKDCREQLNSHGRIPPFIPGQHDTPDKLQISTKIYGREQEVMALSEVFKQVSLGGMEMALVAGYAGIGKTSLVQAFSNTVADNHDQSVNIRFISGKFDQLQQNTPYSAIVESFRKLVQQLLGKGKDRLAVWREKILTAVGPNGQIIIDIIPEVAFVIGPQPRLSKLAPVEAENRFDLVFQEFIQVFCGPDHHLIIFLDDLQWVDAASLKLLAIVIEKQIPYLFLIGAYRDNETDPNHPLMSALNTWKKKEIAIHTILLSPLDTDGITEIVIDSMLKSRTTSAELAKLIEQKTGGNPFFIMEFLKSLYSEKLLRFDFMQGGWHWDLSKIQACCITENVVELLANRIRQFNKETQSTLKIAACIGNRFDLETLAIACDKPEKRAAGSLKEALENGLIAQETSQTLKGVVAVDDYKHQNNLAGSPNQFLFTHDRIQQAAYSLIPDAEKDKSHLRIGQRLNQGLPEDQQEQKLFEIADQLNHGMDLIDQEKERITLISLNLLAGRKAKDTAAYTTAYKYLKIGKVLVQLNDWHDNNALMIDLHMELVEAAYLTGDFDQMAQLTQIVLQHAANLFDKIKVYETNISACIAQHKLMEAVNICRTTLKQLGVHLPKKPGKHHISFLLMEIKVKLFGKQVKDLLNLPEMADPAKKAAMGILSKAFSAAFFVDPQLAVFVILYQTKYSITYGNAAESPFSYALYGLVLCGSVGDIELGNQFGSLALNLLDHFNSQKIDTRASFSVYHWVKHWKIHARETLLPLRDAYKKGLETGDFEFAAYSLLSLSLSSFNVGKNLKLIEKEIFSNSEAIKRLNQTTALNQNNFYLQTVYNLRGISESRCRLKGNAYDEDVMLPIHLRADDKASIWTVYRLKLMLCYLFNNYREALKCLSITEKYLDIGTGLYVFVVAHFYCSLTRLAVYHDADRKEKKRILKNVSSSQKKMKRWAKHAPMNHLHKYYLVEAEKARILGHEYKAMELYEKAITMARENEYINEEALACELGAKFYIEKNKINIAASYMIASRNCYSEWGAKVKVDHLEKTYPQLFPALSVQEKENNNPGTNLAIHMDMATIIKATHAISGETVLSRLMDKLMGIVIENAGARKGFLILKKEKGPVVEARVSASDEAINDFHPLPLEQCRDICKAIVLYVVRTGEDVVLEDAAENGSFTSDTYVMDRRLRSVLCIPIIHNNEITGALYLENNKISSVFTPKQVEILTAVTKILASAWAKNKAEEEVLNYQEQLRSLSSELLLTEERERRRIAVDLHDRIGHALADVMMKLAEIKRVTKAPVLAEPLEKISGIIDQSIEDAHTLTFELSPPILYDLGLEAALDWLCDQIGAQHSIQVVFHDDMHPKSLDETVRVLLFQSTRELLFNMVKHAKTDHATVSLKKEGDDVQLVVADNGIGFDQSKIDACGNKKGGFGLFSIKERLGSQGGYLEIETSSGKGTRITMVLPLQVGSR